MGGFSSRNKIPEETMFLVERKEKEKWRHKGHKECEIPEESINADKRKKKKKWRHKWHKECEKRIKELDQQKELREHMRRIAELEQQNKELRDENKKRIKELDQQKELCDEHMRRIAELEQQNKELRDENKRIAELEKQNKELRDEKKIKEDLGKRYHKLLRRDMGVEVTLDEDTMNPYLMVSEDGRELRWTEQRQNLPDNRERFDEHPCVLGNRLPAGRRCGCYREVEVGNKKYWELGVARGSVPSKGQLSFSPETGFWVLSLWDGKLTALTDPETRLDTEVPTRVGIHVDYEEKKVSFYNAVDGSHIYTFENKIYRKIQPFFSPGNNDTDPLRITEPLGE